MERAEELAAVQLRIAAAKAAESKAVAERRAAEEEADAIRAAAYMADLDAKAMRLSDFIRQLEALAAQAGGDAPVFFWEGHNGYYLAPHAELSEGRVVIDRRREE